MSTEVQVKDRLLEVETLRMALAMAEFPVSYEHADLINEIVKEAKKRKARFDIGDATWIFHNWKERWNSYHKEKGQVSGA